MTPLCTICSQIDGYSGDAPLGIISNGKLITTQTLATTAIPVFLHNNLNSDIQPPANPYGYLRIFGPNTAFSLGGFAAPVAGQTLRVYNSTNAQMSIVDEDTGTIDATHRIRTLTGADVALRAGPSFATFVYDATDLRWVLSSTN